MPRVPKSSNKVSDGSTKEETIGDDMTNGMGNDEDDDIKTEGDGNTKVWDTPVQLMWFQLPFAGDMKTLPSWMWNPNDDEAQAVEDEEDEEDEEEDEDEDEEGGNEEEDEKEEEKEEDNGDSDTEGGEEIEETNKEDEAVTSEENELQKVATDLVDALWLSDDEASRILRQPNPYLHAWQSTVTHRALAQTVTPKDYSKDLVHSRPVHDEALDPMATPPHVRERAREALQKFDATFPLTMQKKPQEQLSYRRAPNRRKVLTYADFLEEDK